MLEKFSQQQLDNKSLTEVAEIRATALAEKVKLENQKKSGKGWTEEKQDELDEVVGFIVDLDEYIAERSKVEKEAGENAEKEAGETTEKYEVAEGTEKHVHLLITRGRKFDPNTGEEISKKYVQLFTFAEWQLFKKSFKGLGYTILKALHDPYGDAAQLVAKGK